MTQPGVMPHPWWQFWQIADFLIMLTVVVLFVRFVRRSDARSKAEEDRRPETPTPSESDVRTLDASRNDISAPDTLTVDRAEGGS